MFETIASIVIGGAVFSFVWTKGLRAFERIEAAKRGREHYNIGRNRK